MDAFRFLQMSHYNLFLCYSQDLGDTPPSMESEVQNKCCTISEGKVLKRNYKPTNLTGMAQKGTTCKEQVQKYWKPLLSNVKLTEILRVEKNEKCCDK